MARQILKIYQWDKLRVKTRQPLECIFEGAVELPKAHDAARKAAQELALQKTGGTIQGCSALASGGFSVSVELPA